MGVGAEEGFSWDAEAFEVDLVADAVAGSGESDALGGADALEVEVVVGVLGSELAGVVVDVLDGQLGLDAVDAHGLQLEEGHGAGGVLAERLVDADAYLLAGHAVALDEVRAQDFLDECL